MTTIHIAHIAAGDEDVYFAATSRHLAERTVANWCRDCWAAEQVEGDHSTMRDIEVIETYFHYIEETGGGEWVNFDEVPLVEPGQ